MGLAMSDTAKETSRCIFQNGVVLDLEQRVIMRNDAPCTVPLRVERLLWYLVDNPCRVISKQELHQHVWDLRPLEESVFSHTIWQVRQLLGDSDRQIVQTAPKKGYIFRIPSGPLNESPNASVAQELQQPAKGNAELRASSAPPKAQPEQRSRIFLYGWLLAFGLVLISVGFNFLRQEPRPRILQLTVNAPYPEVADYLIGVVSSYARRANILVLTRESGAPKNVSQLELSFQPHGINQASALRVQFTNNGEAQPPTRLDLTEAKSILAQLTALLQFNFPDSIAFQQPVDERRLELDSFDFDSIWVAQRPRLITGAASGNDLGVIAFVLNEMGRYPAARFLAREALLQGNNLLPEARCLAEFVQTDIVEPANSHSAALFSNSTSCDLTRARQAELQGHIVNARRYAGAQPSGHYAVIIGMKMAEISQRLEVGASVSAVSLQRLQMLIELAAKTGWRAAKPRLLELLAAQYGLALERDARMETLAQAELDYRALGEQAQADRVWLRRIYFAASLSAADELRIQSLTKTTDERLFIAANLALGRWQTNREDHREKFDAILDRISRLPNVLEKLESLELLRSNASRLNDIKYQARIAVIAQRVSTDFPVLKILSDISHAISHHDTAQGLLDAKAIEQRAVELGIDSQLTSNYCVLATNAAQQQDISAMQHWANKCVTLPLPVHFICLRYWGLSVQMDLARRGLGAAPKENLLEDIFRQSPAPKSNCTKGMSFITYQLIESNKLDQAELFWRTHEKLLPDSPSKALEALNIEAKLCLLRGQVCREKELSAVIASELYSDMRRATFLALKIGIDRKSVV